MIRLDGVHLDAGEFSLRDVSFAVPSGAYAVLMGPTGCGKTTLLEAICGLKAISAGSITIGDVNVTFQPPADRGVGYVPQDGALFATLTVAEHLAFGPRFRGWSRARQQARTAQLADALGLSELLSRRPAGLSGGERQRVALGRALAAEPQVLLLDEPLSAVDEERREELCTLLADLHGRGGVTVLHVTHSRSEAERLGSLRLTLDRGRVETA